MRFITEDDLRLAYKEHAFSVYEAKAGERLTPGGRQFLNDHGIRMDDSAQAGPWMGRDKQVQDEPIGDKAPLFPIGRFPADIARIRCVQASFLQAGCELLDINVLTAQEIFELERQLAGISQAIQDGGAHVGSCPGADLGTAKSPACDSCTGITPDNWASQMEDCFEVTGFHAQSPRGREIVRLHRLRCELRALACTLPEDDKKTVNRIINRLSQMICLAFGGKTCQKKI